MAQGIFHGLTVIDCASFIAAPAAATVLSDFGADVIKIEPPGTGDPWRGAAKRPGNPQSPHDYSWMLEGRNKRSLALDLAKPEGQAVLRRLATGADTFRFSFGEVWYSYPFRFDHPSRSGASLVTLRGHFASGL